jgi:hypothetical protein
MLLIVDEKNGLASGRRSSKSRNLGQSDSFFVEEIDDDLLRYERTGISYKALNALMAFLPEGLAIDAAELVKHITKLVARLASSANRCQSEQEAVLFNAVSRLFAPVPQDIHGSVVAFAKDIIDRSTFGNAFGVFTKLRHAIVGPEKGGKSTFLRVLTNALVCRMFASGQYKKTLLVSIDVATIATSLTDPLKFYAEIVKITIGHLTSQKLEVIPFSESLIAYFTKLPTLEKLVPLPQKFVLQDEFREAVPLLSDIAANLYKCISVHHSLCLWLTNVVLFPRLVALAFGFGNVHFVVDHFDMSDVDLSPVAPFDADPQVITLIEHVKFMVSNDSFTISCSDEEKFIECLDLLTDDGVDLRDGTELVSIVDVDTGHADRYTFQLTVEGEVNPVNLRLKDCGGCLAFLHLWDGIVLQGDQLHNEERKDAKSRTSKELRLSLLAKIRTLAGLVLFKVNPDDRSVTAISKTIKDYVIMDTGAELDRFSVESDE